MTKTWGLDASELEKHVALVVDIHPLVSSAGEYISANDDLIKRVQDSWRGVRSKYALFPVSREDLLVDLPALSLTLVNY